MVILIVALVVGGIIYVVVTAGEPHTTLELPEGGTAEVTPVDEMRVRTAEAETPIDLASYRLTVTGLVQTPLSISFDDIMSMEPQERLVDLPCVEGWTETGLWKGPRLSELLDRAGILEGADNVVFLSPGGYSTSLTLDDIAETDPLLAYGVNGGSLPAEQGWPDSRDRLMSLRRSPSWPTTRAAPS